MNYTSRMSLKNCDVGFKITAGPVLKTSSYNLQDRPSSNFHPEGKPLRETTKFIFTL